jgi:hypothetical protein
VQRALPGAESAAKMGGNMGQSLEMRMTDVEYMIAHLLDEERCAAVDVKSAISAVAA